MIVCMTVHTISHTIACTIVKINVRMKARIEFTNEFHVERVRWTTDDGQTDRMMDRLFNFSEFLEYSQIPKNHEKDACCAKCIFLYTNLYQES